MSALAPMFSLIRALIDDLRRKRIDAHVVGIHSPVPWTGPCRQEHGGDIYHIYPCQSPLQVRLALQDEAGRQGIKVIVTPLGDQDLGEDVLLRLAKGRLLPIEHWQILRALCQARTVDPRLHKHAWMAAELIDALPAEPAVLAPGGFLDAERAWPLLLARRMGLAVERPDLQELLRWSLDPSQVARLREAPEAFRTATLEWLDGVAGPLATPVLRCALANERPDAVALGLALGVIFDPEAAGHLAKAAGRIERLLGGECPAEPLVQRWHAAALDVVRLRIVEPRERGQILGRADEILAEVQAAAFAHVSDVSPLGWIQRLQRVAAGLEVVLASPEGSRMAPLGVLHERALRHDRARQEQRQRARLDMALRLVRWLQSAPERAIDEAGSLADAAARYLAQESYVDWARRTLRGGEPVAELAKVYSLLLRQVSLVRERQNRRFAELLRDWTAAGSNAPDVIPVEQIIDRVLVPIARTHPVLLLVVDGMSAAVARELIEDIAQREWMPIVPESERREGVGISVLPSVTEVSRTSLLCGKRRQGASADESTGFASHPALGHLGRADAPPILFHKVALQQGEQADLSPEVRQEIGSANRRVVGVVINAVDDHLLKGEQLDVRWTRDEIKVLPTLLHEARDAGRIIVMVADHGHVLEAGTEFREHSDGERWRREDGPVAEGEIAIHGERVEMPKDRRLIAPWSERVRYGMKKNGYHGGVTPQEMIVPVIVLAPEGSLPSGWTENPPVLPDWWEGRPAPRPRETGSKVPTPAVSRPGLLFDLDHAGTKSPRDENVAAGQPAAPSWIPALLASAVFDQQKRMAGRALPSPEEMTRFCLALDVHGGKLTVTALARHTEQSSLRMRPLLAVMQRILNVDGFAVLTRDEASDTVELNRELLQRQFDLI